MKVSALQIFSIVLVLFLGLAFHFASAQTDGANTQTKPGKFSLGLGIGYGKSFGDSAEGGVLFSVEPGLDVSDAIRLGIRYQQVLLTRGTEGLDSEDFNRAPISSLLFSIKFRLLQHTPVKPFVALGAGWYAMRPVNVDFGGGTYDFTQSSNEFGGNIRAGIDVKRFFLLAEFNFIPESKNELYVGPDMIGEVTVKNNYLAFTVGYVINGR